MANNNAWSHPPPFWDYMNGFEGPRGSGRRNGPPAPPPGPANHWADFWAQGGPAMWSQQGFGGRRHRGPRPDVFFDHFEEGDLATDDENAQENDTEKTVTPDTTGEAANAGEDSAADAQGPRRHGLGGRGGRGRGRGMGGRGLGRGRGGMRGHRHHHHHHQNDEDVPMLSETDLTPTSSDEETDANATADPEKTGLTEDESANEQAPRDFAGRGRGRGRGLGRGGMGGRGRGRGGFGGRGAFTNVRVNVPGWRGEAGAENAEGPRARRMHGHGHGHGHHHGHDHGAGPHTRQQQWMDMMMAQGYGPFGGPHHHNGPVGRDHGPPGFGGPGRFNGPHGSGGMFDPHAREIPAEEIPVEESAEETHAVQDKAKNKNKDKKNKMEKKDKKNKNKNKEQQEQQQQQQQPTETPEVDQATNDQQFGGFQVNAKGKFPAIDIFDGAEAYEIHANVPGASKDDIEINWNPKTSRLIITGTIAPAGDEDFLTTRSKNERKVGDFKRRVLLGQEGTPASVVAENITARVEDGVLRVVVPKAEADLVHVEKEDMQ